VVNDSADVTSSGRSFQVCGSVTGKARLPTVDSLLVGTTRRLVSTERSDRRLGRSATRVKGPIVVLRRKSVDEFICHDGDPELKHPVHSTSFSFSFTGQQTFQTIHVNDGAFSMIAAARSWNALPRHVTSAPSLPVFCSGLKTHVFG